LATALVLCADLASQVVASQVVASQVLTLQVLASHVLASAGALSVMAAIFAAALVSSIAGFAFSAICGAMLFHLDPDQVEVVQIMLVCSIGIQALAVWALWRKVDWRALWPFLIGGVAGLPAGIALLLRSDHGVYTRLMGGLLVLYGAYMIFRRPIVLRRQGPLRDAVAGFLGGITGGAAAFPGAPVTIWCATKGLDRDGQRAIYQPFILIMQIVALAAIHAVRRGGWEGAQHLSVFGYLPAALLGAACGLAFYRRLDDRQFLVAVNILLIAAGGSLAM
jgi:uncharacterized protein